MKVSKANTAVGLTMAASIALIAGCGGGGEAETTPTTSSATAEGVYGGNLTGSSSPNFQLLVLENSEFWSIYGTQTTTSFVVRGFLQGPGVSSSGSYASLTARDYGFTPAIGGVVNASYNASAGTISGTFSSLSLGNVGFSGGPIAGSLYNYNTPALISAVAGSWALGSLSGETISLTISASGAITARTNLGCSFSGSMIPRPSGKNVFNVTLSFGASPCAFPGLSATGIAITYPLSNGRRQLIVAGANSGGTLGMAAFGTR
jgi:hypothetical protein